MPASPALKTILGQPSWRIATGSVEAYLTQTGGHLGPVTFTLKGRKIQPYSVAPWHTEKLGREHPHIIKGLRGDFFCLPFGGNSTPFRGERHPVHGETANRPWALEQITQDASGIVFRCGLRTKIRKGRVQKIIALRAGDNAIYQKHIITGMSGPMPLGHHAMLSFPDEPGAGLISTSVATHRQVWLEPTESPAARGYSSLQPGAIFKNLNSVPTVWNTKADLSRFPARRGFEDIVINVNDRTLPWAWTAVVFPRQRYVWFALKDPKVLSATLMWISNGGRHYAPWNGRHVNVLGLEEITGFFHTGLADSAGKNPLRKFMPTAVNLHPTRPLEVNYIMAVASIPAGFDHVDSIEGVDGGVILASRSGKLAAASLDLSFLLSKIVS